jgi:hypothetical protein
MHPELSCESITSDAGFPWKSLPCKLVKKEYELIPLPWIIGLAAKQASRPKINILVLGWISPPPIHQMQDFRGSLFLASS